LDEGHLLEPVDAELGAHLRTLPGPGAALFARGGLPPEDWGSQPPDVTQARDIFDLKLLLDGGAGKEKLPADTATEIPKAIENAMTIGFDEIFRAGPRLPYGRLSGILRIAQSVGGAAARGRQRLGATPAIEPDRGIAKNPESRRPVIRDAGYFCVAARHPGKRIGPAFPPRQPRFRAPAGAWPVVHRSATQPRSSSQSRWLHRRLPMSPSNRRYSATA